jgi:hypothetical protein
MALYVHKSDKKFGAKNSQTKQENLFSIFAIQIYKYHYACVINQTKLKEKNCVGILVVATTKNSCSIHNFCYCKLISLLSCLFDSIIYKIY